MAIPPSGEQHPIARGDQRATIVEVGGGVREYAVGDRDVLEPYALDAVCDGAHGAPLIPWPNRLADGRYEFDGTEHRVALTEPEKSNAIHGFLRWRSWRPAERSASRVAMETRLHPLTGWPFTLDLRIAYELTDEGLVVSTTATNVGGTACPFASGQHPYLATGGGQIDECTLQLDAATRVDTDAERQLPVGEVPVAGTEFDFREPRRLSDQAIDFAFTDLARDGDGRAWMRLEGTDGHRAELWVDEGYPYLEAYTGDTLGEGRRRTGLGAEPMSAPPNALQTGGDVVRLEPGESVTTRWGARLSSA
jgi:aldose 1-epimerase